ncbi:DUF935 domain-containing protein [Methylosinus sp. Sm6]|uniref:DUF935 domain-containing protein n=1 Tax=Methylosinus sp. Sm6 TaxID=2866948 RepID=UPI001C98FCDF|nr:DUF935 domain-containing protein [Methylosinus sp. Sm6]
MVETKRSKLLGPDGNPIDPALLTQEIAAPEQYGPRAIMLDVEATGLTPGKLAGIMRQANHGLARAYLTLAFDMEERYLHYASQLQTRRLAIDGVTLSVSAPKGVDAKVVDYVQSLTEHPMFRDMIQDMQDGLGKGYSVIEPLWDYSAGALRPTAYKYRDPRYFRYDDTGLTKLHMLDEAGALGLEVTTPYFIRHEPNIRAGLPIRAGLARSAAWAFMAQSYALQDWSAFAEIYGIPFRIGKYHPAATAADKATLLRAVRSIANDAAAILPAGMEIDFQEVNGNRGEAVFGHLIKYLDDKVSLVVIGQTMTAENGSSLGQAKVHNEVRHDIQRSDARQTAATLQRDLIEPAVAMNFGPQAVYPVIQLEIAQAEDLKAFADFLGVAVPLGLEVGQTYARKKASIPEPDDGEKLLAPQAGETPRTIPDPTPPSQQLAAALVAHNMNMMRGARLGAGCGCPMCGAAPRSSARLAADDPNAVTAIDETDELVDEALSDYQEIVDPLLAGLLAAVGEATTFEEALANLETAKIDTGPLLDRLARATAISRGLGDLKD